MAKKNIKLNYALKSEADKTQPALLYVMFTLGGKRKKISLGYKVVLNTGTLIQTEYLYPLSRRNYNSEK